jgi:hypothetical protein
LSAGHSLALPGQHRVLVALECFLTAKKPAAECSQSYRPRQASRTLRPPPLAQGYVPAIRISSHQSSCISRSQGPTSSVTTRLELPGYLLCLIGAEKPSDPFRVLRGTPGRSCFGSKIQPFLRPRRPKAKSWLTIPPPFVTARLSTWPSAAARTPS